MKNPFIVIALIGVVIAVVLGVVFYREVRGPRVGGNFVLQHPSGEWTFRDHAKDLNLLYIGYAKCPDVCPMVLAHTSHAFSQLKADEVANTNLIFVSVDVDNDTPESVATYATQFFKTFIGLSGTRAQVDSVSKFFNSSYTVDKDEKSYLGYSISHADRLYFLNKKGFVIDEIQTPRSGDVIVSKIREHL